MRWPALEIQLGTVELILRYPSSQVYSAAYFSCSIFPFFVEDLNTDTWFLVGNDVLTIRETPLGITLT